jgi:electron transport complex protein RnfB
MIPVTENKTGWDAWSENEAIEAQSRYEARKARLIREKSDSDKRLANKAEKKLKALDIESAETELEKSEIERKKAIIAAAMARAREKQNQHSGSENEPND